MEERVCFVARDGLEPLVPALEKAVGRWLDYLGESAAELSVVLTGDGEIRRLNATYRNRDQPTDVLAFSQRDGEGAVDSSLLGDVVISVPTAERQAAERGHSLELELRELLAHGLLHLLGYDHEVSEGEAVRHLEKQRDLLALIDSN